MLLSGQYAVVVSGEYAEVIPAASQRLNAAMASASRRSLSALSSPWPAWLVWLFDMFR